MVEIKWPIRGSKEAPKFDPEEPVELLRYIAQVEEIWKGKTIDMAGKKKGLCKYALLVTEQEWMAFDTYDKAILFIPPQIPLESAGIWEFQWNLQELTGIPEFQWNPSESPGINWNLHKSRGVYYKRYNITFGNHLNKGPTSFSKFFFLHIY